MTCQYCPSESYELGPHHSVSPCQPLRSRDHRQRIAAGAGRRGGAIWDLRRGLSLLTKRRGLACGAARELLQTKGHDEK